MYRKSLEINERLGRLLWMANDYGNLGAVLCVRGDLEGARELLMKSCDLYIKVGAKHKAEPKQHLIDILPG